MGGRGGLCWCGLCWCGGFEGGRAGWQASQRLHHSKPRLTLCPAATSSPLPARSPRPPAPAEWLAYLRTHVGYDGWRLDYVRGFHGSHVKDYMEASGPQFAVGE